MFLYGGPDQIMPLVSFLGSIGALVMIFWGKLFSIYNKITGLFSAKREATTDKPQGQ